MTDKRRKHQRVPAQGPGTLVGTDGAERSFELIDLSESGARLRCAAAIDAMTRVKVVLFLPGERLGHTEDARLETTGVVVWSHETDDASFDTGVFFPELDDDSASMLRSFVATAA